MRSVIIIEQIERLQRAAMLLVVFALDSLERFCRRHAAPRRDGPSSGHHCGAGRGEYQITVVLAWLSDPSRERCIGAAEATRRLFRSLSPR
jgi:hypothetical protein